MLRQSNRARCPRAILACTYSLCTATLATRRDSKRIACRMLQLCRAVARQEIGAATSPLVVQGPLQVLASLQPLAGRCPLAAAARQHNVVRRHLPPPAAACQPSSSMNGQRSTPCTFFQRGHCRQGSACRFAHNAAACAPASPLPFDDRQYVQSQVIEANAGCSPPCPAIPHDRPTTSPCSRPAGQPRQPQ
jgi:hypothetical protein